MAITLRGLLNASNFFSISYDIPREIAVFFPIQDKTMQTNSSSRLCDNPSYFSEVLTPAIEQRLPQKDSLSARILDHTTAIRPFFDTVSQDLCDDGQIGEESAKKTVTFITRSATSAIVLTSTASLAALGLVIGSPALAIGAGVIGLSILPPVAERVAFGAIDFITDLFATRR